jgi:general secretion pathway protein L
MMTGEAVPAKVDGDAFEAGLADALNALPVDLRQGPFAKVQPWQLDTRRLRRIAGFAALALLVMLLVSLAQLFRYNLAADVAETAVATEARALLPRDTDLYDPVAQVRAHVAEQGGAGGFSATAAALFTALRDTPGAEVTSLRYDPAGGLSVAVATVQGGDLQTIQDRLRAAGYEPTAGTLRNEAERAVTDITVRPR